jgi:hypothetical protein
MQKELTTNSTDPSLPHPTLQINREEVLRYVAKLCGNSRVTWQTLADNKSAANSGRLIQTLYGCNDVTLLRLQDFQQAGAGVYCTVNETDGEGRKTNNIVRVRSLVLDLDSAPLDPVLICKPQPQIIVESSPNRYHCYWLVEGCSLERYKPLQRLLMRRFDGDPAVCDLPRVMRVPGTWHLKDPNHPFQTRIVTITNTPPYPLAEVIAGLALHEADDAGLPLVVHDLDEVDLPAVINEAKEVLPDRVNEAIAPDYLWTDPLSGEYFDLRSWAATFRGFKLATSLRKCRPKALIGPMVNGKQQIRCVNADQHTDQTPDNATFVMDAQDSSTGGFVYCCLHAHCQGIDRLTFIRMMLAKGWLTPADLTDKRFNIITDPKHPAFVKFDADAAFGVLQLLPPPLQRNLILLGTSSLRKCNGGTLPDDDLIISMMLDIPEHDWAGNKITLQRLGILSIADGRILINHFHDLYLEATESYIKAAISGSRGGRASHAPPT